MTLIDSLLPELDVAIAQSAPQRRSDILLSILDAFVRGAPRFSDEEIAVFDDILLRLTAELEIAVREKLSVGLAPIPRAPLKVIWQLANDDEIRVAGPILSESIRLDENDLARIAKSKGQAHLVAVSRRRTLSETITEILVERGNREVLLTLSKNLGAKFSGLGFSRLIKRSEGDDILATNVGLRTDLPRSLVVFLLTTASMAVRNKLMNERRYDEDAVREAIRAVTANVNGSGGSRQSNAHPQNGELSPGDVTAIRKFVEAGQVEEAIEGLAQLCDVPINALKRGLARDRVGSLLVLAKAAGFSWSFTQSLLESPVHPLATSKAELLRYKTSFERMATRTARQIVEFYRMQNRKA
jgi:uncharacterized protein (DUF2336 family)